jgi:ubiquinone biosynthesis protein
MVRLLIQILVNTIAIAITAELLPGIGLAEPLSEDSLFHLLYHEVTVYPLLGTGFALLQIFVRPVILLLTAQLIIWSMGLVSIAINAILFYPLAMISRSWWIVATPEVLWVMLAGSILGIVVTLLEGVVGLNSPLISTGRQTSRFYWRWLGLLPRNRRNRIAESLRILQVYDTLRRYSTHIAISLTPLAPFRRMMQRVLYSSEQVVTTDHLPQVVRLLLQALGPTYVKLGQLLASRTDFLPKAWQDELSQLQSKVEPFSYAQVQRTIIQELGTTPEEGFATFDPQPIAAASLGQVHCATLPDGAEVVVKVQRPDIHVTVRADLNVIQDSIRLLESRMRWARELGLGDFVEEFATNMVDELDYHNEAYNARRLAHAMEVFPHVRVPVIYEAYTTTSVLTMERVDGVPMTQRAALEESPIDPEHLAREFLRAMLKQVIVDGFFHGDPHPGNVLVDRSQHQLLFIDLGLMGQLSTQQQLAIIDVIWSLKDLDAANLVAIILGMSTAFKPINRAALTRDIERLLYRYVRYSDTSPSFSVVMEEMLTVVQRHGVHIFPELTLALKALMQSEELIRSAAPSLSLVDSAVEEMEHVLQQDYTRDTIRDGVESYLTNSAREVVRHLPRMQAAAQKWMEQVERGRLTIYVEMDDTTRQRIDHLERSVVQVGHRVTLALTLVGVLISAAIIGLIYPQEDWTDVVIMFVGVLALALVSHMIWLLWRQQQ